MATLHTTQAILSCLFLVNSQQVRVVILTGGVFFQVLGHEMPKYISHRHGKVVVPLSVLTLGLCGF